MNKPSASRIRVRDLTYIAFCTTLIIICAWIKIPFVIPMTMQSFGVFITAGLLGGKHACVSVLLYILLGAIGLPVFSGFTGGVGMLFSNTGGYIIGFLWMPILQWIFERFAAKQKYIPLLSQALGLLLCYSFGTAWYLFMYTEGFNINTLTSVLGICVFPFLLPDTLKLILASFITAKLKKHIK